MRKVASENGLVSPLRPDFELLFNNPEMEDKAFDESFDDTDKLPLSSQLTETVPGAGALPPLPPRMYKRRGSYKKACLKKGLPGKRPSAKRPSRKKAFCNEAY